MNKFDIIDVLLVEDNQNDAELTIRALQKNNIIKNIYVLEDGAEALDFFFCKGKFEERNIKNSPKVVLLDLKLPKVSGLEVLKIIKSNKNTSSIPIVMLTSSREEPDIKEAYFHGVNSYVVKPVDFDQFVASMNALGVYWLSINQF